MAVVPLRLLIRLKSIYLRITLTRTTLLFFILTFVLCFAQGLIQSFLYRTDARASHLVSSILDAAHVPYKSQFAWLQRLPSTDSTDERFFLSLCTRLPHGSDPGNCTAVFDSARPFTGSDGSYHARRSEDQVLSTAGAPQAVYDPNTGALDGVSLQLEQAGRTVFLDERCTRVLIYPDQTFKNAKREELAFVGSQVWLFGASTYAILYESVPHLIAVVITRVMMTAWSAYAIWRNKDIETRIHALVSGPTTPCQADLFPGYFTERQAYEIPDVILGMTALIVLGWCSLRLISLYSQHTFQHVCPTPSVLRLYRLVMAVCASLQLSAQFALASSALWLDQLIHGAIGRISSHTPVYVAQIVFVILILLPWSILGWYALTRENRRAAYAFLATSLLTVTTWSALFSARVYRWTFAMWPFFGAMTLAACASVLGAGLFGALCVFQFGRGLKQFLHASSTLASIGFEPEVFTHAPDADPEKAPPQRVSFPSLGGRKPSHGSDDVYPPPTYVMRFDRDEDEAGSVTLSSVVPGAQGSVADREEKPPGLV